jgi:hypothetical protein
LRRENKTLPCSALSVRNTLSNIIKISGTISVLRTIGSCKRVRLALSCVTAIAGDLLASGITGESVFASEYFDY